MFFNICNTQLQILVQILSVILRLDGLACLIYVAKFSSRGSTYQLPKVTSPIIAGALAGNQIGERAVLVIHNTLLTNHENQKNVLTELSIHPKEL